MDSSGVRYPWAMAPTINRTKLVSTAIATFGSTDKFIIFPSIMAATPDDPRFLNFPLFDRFEFHLADGWAADAAMFATANLSSVGFDVRCLMFD